jgi:hypothetical protein
MNSLKQKGTIKVPLLIGNELASGVFVRLGDLPRTLEHLEGQSVFATAFSLSNHHLRIQLIQLVP